MNPLASAELDTVASSKTTAPMEPSQTEDKESCIQPESIPTASQHESVVPGFSNLGKSEELTIQSPVQSLQHAQTETDPFGEKLLMSFQDSTMASPPSPTGVSTATAFKIPSPPRITFPAIMDSIYSETAVNNSSPTSLGSSTMTPPSDFATSQSYPSQSGDQGSKCSDHGMDTIAPTSFESTTTSKLLCQSPEDTQVLLLRDKVEQAAAKEQALQKEWYTILNQKRNYDIEAADRSRDLDAVKAAIRRLHASKREILAEVKQKKARQSELVHDLQRLERTASAKWQEGKFLKRDVDEAAQSRLGLEKQLKEAEYREELARLYPDAGLRRFAEKMSTDIKHGKLIYAIAQGQANDVDFDAIESLLEEAEDGTKSDVKVEEQPRRNEPSEPGANRAAYAFLTSTDLITRQSRAAIQRGVSRKDRKH